MALMLQAANATVTVAHSRTADLAAHTKDADILVVAAGRPGMVGAEHVRPGAAVVDVGIHRRPEGGLCGDVVAAEVEPIAAALSGAGRRRTHDGDDVVNTVVAWCRRHGIDHGLDDLIVWRGAMAFHWLFPTPVLQVDLTPEAQWLQRWRPSSSL